MEKIIIKEESFEDFKNSKCPKCKHYNTREYQECNIVKQIDGKMNCKNYIGDKELI